MKKVTALILIVIGCLWFLPGCGKGGVEYELHGSGEYYIVTGKTDNANKYLEIASEYRDKPVCEIADHAFENWEELDSVIIPKTIRRIGEKAFYGCKKLQNLQIEEGVKEVGEKAVGKGYLEIGDFAFSDCDSLTKVILPKSLKRIGKGAFFDCHNIYDINLSTNVQEIGTDAFAECGFLMLINVEGMNQYFKSTDGVLYNADESILIQYPQARGEETYSIGFETIEIKEKAFMNADVEFVDINNMILEKIGEYAFHGCKKIQTITIGEKVKSIGAGCFSGCEKLQTIIFNDPEGWTAVKKNSEEEIIDSKELLSDELSDPDTARILLQEYSEYQWIKD